MFSPLSRHPTASMPVLLLYPADLTASRALLRATFISQAPGQLTFFPSETALRHVRSILNDVLSQITVSDNVPYEDIQTPAVCLYFTCYFQIHITKTYEHMDL